MSRWKNWKHGKRMPYAILAAIVLAAGAWTLSHTESFASSKSSSLEAPIPPTQDVFLQMRSNSDGKGNAFVLVQLTSNQVKAKQIEGTEDFLSIGSGDKLVLLRDDGRGGDSTAKDGLYTGIALVDIKDLQDREAADKAELAQFPRQLIPSFSGRAAVDVERPAAFDLTNFSRGLPVLMTSSVHFLGVESVTAPPISSTNPVVPGTNNYQRNVLMITHTDVVSDPARTYNPCNNSGAANGVWTFNHLMTEMANATLSYTPETFVQDWLETWTTTQTINGETVPSRAGMQAIIDEWPKINGQLDLTKSPLRLLAIVPRVDLRGGGVTGGYGGGANFNDAGELRFIFGFVAKKTLTFDPAAEFIGAVPIGSSTTCYALPFTVILEYLVERSGCTDVRAWARLWEELAGLLPSSSTYRNKLAALTEDVVVPGHNGVLRQLRTNEIALAPPLSGLPWELRQFSTNCFTAPDCPLAPAPVSDTIRNDLNGTTLFGDWVDKIKTQVLIPAGNFEAPIPPTHRVPVLYQSQNFLAGKSHVTESNPDLIRFHMGNVPSLPQAVDVDPASDIYENWARHRVSREGCNGCHRRDTFTSFVHVNPAETIITSTWDDNGGGWVPAGPAHASATLPAELSLFLTGINQLGDPANAVWAGQGEESPSSGSPKRNFDDLARRELDLGNVADMVCSGMMHINHAAVMAFRERNGVLPDDLFAGVPLDARLSIGVEDIRRNFISEVH